jgi:hypothetical protein
MMDMILCIIILSIPVYFLSLLILRKKNIGSKTNRKFIAFIPTVIVSPILYVMVISLWLLSSLYYPKQTFDHTKWHENVDERYKMSSYIIKNNILMGKTKDEIIELLGNDFYVRGKDMIGYYLGFVPGIANIDPDVLVIYFENGIVVKVEQIRTT